jgi:hypothetical protein
MRRLRRVSGAEAIRALERRGFKQVRQRGSYVILKKETDQGPVGWVFPSTVSWRSVRCRGFLDKLRCGPRSSWKSFEEARRVRLGAGFPLTSLQGRLPTATEWCQRHT